MAYSSFHNIISLPFPCFLIYVLKYRNSVLLNHLLDAMKHPPFHVSKLHPTIQYNYIVLIIVLHTKKFLNNKIRRTQNFVLLKADFTA